VKDDVYLLCTMTLPAPAAGFARDSPACPKPRVDRVQNNPRKAEAATSL